MHAAHYFTFANLLSITLCFCTLCTSNIINNNNTSKSVMISILVEKFGCSELIFV